MVPVHATVRILDSCAISPQLTITAGKHITRLKIYFAQKNASCIEIWNPLAGRIYMLADISDISSISIPHDTRLGLHKLHDLWYTLNTKTITKRWVTPNV